MFLHSVTDKKATFEDNVFGYLVTLLTDAVNNAEYTITECGNVYKTTSSEVVISGLTGVIDELTVKSEELTINITHGSLEILEGDMTVSDFYEWLTKYHVYEEEIEVDAIPTVHATYNVLVDTGSKPVIVEMDNILYKLSLCDFDRRYNNGEFDNAYFFGVDGYFAGKRVSVRVIGGSKFSIIAREESTCSEVNRLIEKTLSAKC